MASKNFFEVHGAKEIAKELKDLSRGMQNKIVRPALNVAVAEVRKTAKQLAPKDTGILKKAIKSKVFTKKRGAKGIVGRIGVLDSNVEYSDGTPVAKVAAVLNHGSPARNIYARNFLEDALKMTEPQATAKLLARTQVEIDKFHAKRKDKGKVSKK
jgi:HK97 gp10 family phage protein